jgi:hypothetical protein
MTEPEFIADLDRLLVDGLIEVDDETVIIGGRDAEAPRFRPTPAGHSLVSQLRAAAEEEPWISPR